MPAFDRNRVLASAAAIAIAASGALGATLLTSETPAFAQVPAQHQATATAQAPVSFADVVEKVKPAVVAVKVKMETAAADAEFVPSQLDPGQMEGLPPQLRDLFRHFGQEGDQQGGPQMPRMQPRKPHMQQALGSGFFISADGYVITNNHVVDHAKTVSVTTDDGRELDAKVIGTDPKTDLALLKVTDGGPFPYVSLAKASPRVGDWVVAIGNPFGLGGTVTSGIVSARGRDIGAGPYDDFLQIDAPINRGNSGGPAFNLNGEVVGVNTAIFSPSGGSVGLGFAIPASTVQTVVDQLKADGHVTRGYLGVMIQPVGKEIAEAMGLATPKGALVDTVQDDTPAAKAGLKSGDVITAFNGDPVADARELTRKVGTLKPGAKAEITYLRNGEKRTATVDLGTLPGEKTAKADLETQDGLPKLGLQLAPADQVQGAGGEGVAVVGVDPNGAAAEKGIKTGDVILEIGGHPVTKPSDVKDGLAAARKDGKKAVLMKVKTAKATRYVAVVFPKA